MNDKEDYAGLIERLLKFPMFYRTDGSATWINSGQPEPLCVEAASALTTLTQQNQQMRELFREWLETELDAMDEEYQPWMDSFTARVKTLVGDMALPIANGGASTTASGTPCMHEWNDKFVCIHCEMAGSSMQAPSEGRPVKPHRSGGGLPAEPKDLPLPNYTVDPVIAIACKLSNPECDHEWEHGDGRNTDSCIKCGLSFLAYVHMEAP